MKPDLSIKNETSKPSSHPCAAEVSSSEDDQTQRALKSVEVKLEALSDVIREATAAEDVDVDMCKSLPRLPSIKHLQLDFGMHAWPSSSEQYFFPQHSPTSAQRPQAMHSAPSSPRSISPTTSFSFPPSPISFSIPQSPVSILSPPHTPTIHSNSIQIHSAGTTSTLSSSHISNNVKSLFASSSALSTSSSSLPSSTAGSSSSLSPMQVQDVPMSPASSQSFGFIETTFASGPAKKTHRRRPANVDKGSLYCHNCGAKNTPEWRRGPGGPATLCNACGLAYAKRLRQDDDMPSPQTIGPIVAAPANSVTAAASGIGFSSFTSCSCAQAATYGRCVHIQSAPAPQPQRGQQQQQQQQQSSRPMQMTKGMPVRINSHTFHNYTPPTPHPSLQHRTQSAPVFNHITFY